MNIYWLKVEHHMTVFPWYIDSVEMKETDDGLANVPVLFLLLSS
ncbi:hypothetical protein [Paenibacillus polymyxa]|nr:hypothetical protein [Paenibacillus polymyxa]